jgi:octopine/nopaline transport system substrate-binding protein
MSFVRSLPGLLAGAVALSALAGGALAQTKTVTIASEGAYAPWNIMQPDGKLTGYEIDLANDLCKRMKVECKIIATDWDGMIPALQAGKFDAIMAGMNITEKRKETIAFSEAYGATPNGFMVLKSGPLANLPGTGATYSLKTQEAEGLKAVDALKTALKGKALGAQGSTTNSAFLDKYFKDISTVREYKTTEQHDLDLAAGRLDATFAQLSYIHDTLKKPDYKDYTVAGATFTGGVLGDGVAVGLRKSDVALKASFDEAIKAAMADGTIKALSTKWFGFDITPQ